MTKKLTLLEKQILNELKGLDVQAFIYTRDDCNYCTKAKSIMNNYGIKYHEANISRNQEDLNVFNHTFGPGTTKPQIYIARVPQDQEVKSEQWEYIAGGCSGFEQWVKANLEESLYEAKQNKLEFYLFSNGCPNCNAATALITSKGYTYRTRNAGLQGCIDIISQTRPQFTSFEEISERLGSANTTRNPNDIRPLMPWVWVREISDSTTKNTVPSGINKIPDANGWKFLGSLSELKTYFSKGK